MLYMLMEILIAQLLLIPVFVLLNNRRFHCAGKAVRYYVFAAYLSAVYLFVGLPTVLFLRFELSLTLLPFLPMLADVRNTLLNILLFFPLGILFPCLWTRYRSLKRTLLFGFGLSASIELLQILTYRATDINDIIANTLGAALGYLAFRLLSPRMSQLSYLSGDVRELPLIFLSVFSVMFFLQPCLAALFYTIT